MGFRLMLTRSQKALFYAVASPLMSLNGWAYRKFRATHVRKNTKVLRLHLGPGQKSYLPGWINIDANMFSARCDLWADLNNPLPFNDNSVDAVYSHHVIEHLPDIEKHICDVFRVLTPGAIYRVAGPHGDNAIKKFIEQDHDWFGTWPDHFDSIGGRLQNFLLCRNEHLAILTESLLRELAARAGFESSHALAPATETNNRSLFEDAIATESERDTVTPHTIVYELRKPGLRD